MHEPRSHAIMSRFEETNNYSSLDLLGEMLPDCHLPASMLRTAAMLLLRPIF